MASSAEELAQAAAHALERISSSARRRSQPGTPLMEVHNSSNIRRKNKAQGDLLDMFISPSKPKSRLRMMAESSTKRHPRPSAPVQPDETQVELVLDLGTPAKSPLDASIVNIKPLSKRSATATPTPRRLSVASRKSASPVKLPQTSSIDQLLDDLQLSKALSPRPDQPPQVPKTGSRNRAKSSKLNSAGSSALRQSRRLTMLRDEEHLSSASASASASSAQIHDPPPEGSEEVCETVDCDRCDNPTDSADQHEGDSESESDFFDVCTLVPQKAGLPLDEAKLESSPSEDAAPEEVDSESDNDAVIIPVRKAKGPAQRPRSKLVLCDSDSGEETPSDSSDQDALASSVVCHNKPMPSVRLASAGVEKKDEDSDDSIVISPARASQFRTLRAKALATSTSEQRTSNPLTAIHSNSQSKACAKASPGHIPTGHLNDVIASSPSLAVQKSKLLDQHDMGKLAGMFSSLAPPSSSTDVPLYAAQPQPSPKTRGPVKTGNAPGPSKKREIPFAKRREMLAENLVELLDEKVFGRRLPPKIDLIWSNRLNTTAGKAKWTVFKDPAGTVLREKVAIELGSKVVDSEQRLKNTLAHELCHVATWILDRQKDGKHGPYFKAWAKRVHKAMPDITITTRHQYEISYKFNWRCERDDCPKTYGRHSNSIKPEKHICACGGSLIPIPRTKRGAAQPTSNSSDKDPLAEILSGLKVD